MVRRVGCNRNGSVTLETAQPIRPSPSVFGASIYSGGIHFTHTCPQKNKRERECVIFVLYYTLKSRISRKSNIRDFVVPASVTSPNHFLHELDVETDNRIHFS